MIYIRLRKLRTALASVLRVSCPPLGKSFHSHSSIIYFPFTYEILHRKEKMFFTSRENASAPNK